jgi:uncharacterized protein with PIN domain
MEALLPFLLDFEKEIARSKDPERAKAFWKKLAWEIETCAEAAEVFPDMTKCPICGEVLVDGVMVHKFSQEIVN